MTEKEKMLTGKYNLGWNAELTAEREQTKDLLFDFNNTKPTLRKEREQMNKRSLDERVKYAG